MARTARAEVQLKQARALALVHAGKNYDEIADDLGYASRASAWKCVQNGLKATVDRLAEDHLTLEQERLDLVQCAYWDAAAAGDMRAALVVLKVIETRIRLLGLDKAKPASEAVRSVVMTPDEVAEWEAGRGAGRRPAR